MVKYGTKIYIFGRIILPKSLCAGIDTLQIIQPGGKDKFPLPPKYPSRLPDIQKQIMAENFFRLCRGLLRDLRKQPASTVPAAFSVQGKHIFLGIICHTFIHIPVHMNGHTGYHQQIPVNIDKSRLQTLCAFYYNPACH